MTLLEQHEIKNGAIDGVCFERLAKEFGTPLYIYSATALKRNVQALREALKMSQASVFFAVKACSNISVLRLLGEEGLGADIVSAGEMARALAAGIPASKIVFSGVGKTSEEILAALTHEIHSFNVESLPELELISRLAVSCKLHATVALRFNPDVDAKTHPYISTGLRENKFGIPRKDILAALPRLALLPGVSVAGISIHIGSQLLSLSPLASAFEATAKLRIELEKGLGLKLKFIDLGGGLGIQYKKEKSPDLKKYGALVKKWFPDIPVSFEPGRSLVGNAGILLSRILVRKERGKQAFLVVDAAMNDLARPSLYGSYHEIIRAFPYETSQATRPFDIVGPVCETSDCFGRARPLAADVKAGQLLALLSAGAYGFSMASTYNSRPRPAEVLVEQGKATQIRRRETIQELFASELPSKGLTP